MKLSPRIEAYREDVENIMSWLSSEKWLGQDEFDRLSSGKKSNKAIYYTGETVMPPLWGSLHILLVQHLMADGLVNARKRKGKVEYSLPPPPNNAKVSEGE